MVYKLQRSAVINQRSSPWLIKRNIKALKGRNSEAPGSKHNPKKRRQKVTKSGEVWCALFAEAPVEKRKANHGESQSNSQRVNTQTWR